VVAVALFGALLLPSTGLASTSRAAVFALPVAADDALGDVRAAAPRIVWTDGARLWGMDLRRGVPFLISRKPGAYDVDGTTVAQVVDVAATDATPATQRIRLHDLRANVAFPQAVEAPAWIETPFIVGPPRLSGGLLVFTVRDGATGLTRVFGASYDPALRAVGTPFAISGQGSAVSPDVASGTVVWWQANRDAGVMAALVDLTAAPPFVSSFAVSAATPVDDVVSTAVSDDLVAWDSAEGGAQRVVVSRLDRASGTASPPVTVSGATVSAVRPDVADGLVFFTAESPYGSRARVYGVAVDSSSATPAAGEPFLVGGVDATQVCAGDGLVTWLEFRSGAYRPRAALIDPVRPTSRALAAASASSGGVATVRYRVDDPLWKAKVTLVLKTRGGRTVQVVRVGWRRVNRSATTRFTCTLAPGVYKFTVKATSLSGRTVAEPGGARLTVRP
jgi:hypothetical protein